MEEAVRWNIKVSRATDLALRSYLGAQGTKKGDLSKFIDEAVRAQVFQRTVQDMKTRNAEPIWTRCKASSMTPCRVSAETALPASPKPCGSFSIPTS